MGRHFREWRMKSLYLYGRETFKVVKSSRLWLVGLLLLKYGPVAPQVLPAAGVDGGRRGRRARALRAGQRAGRGAPVRRPAVAGAVARGARAPPARRGGHAARPPARAAGGLPPAAGTDHLRSLSHSASPVTLDIIPIPAYCFSEFVLFSCL